MKKKSAYVVELCQRSYAKFGDMRPGSVKRYWWRLRSSGNWRILGHSEMLNTKRARDAVALPLAKALGAQVREAESQPS